MKFLIEYRNKSKLEKSFTINAPSLERAHEWEKLQKPQIVKGYFIDPDKYKDDPSKWRADVIQLVQAGKRFVNPRNN